jgi:hypothetical protein
MERVVCGRLIRAGFERCGRDSSCRKLSVRFRRSHWSSPTPSNISGLIPSQRGLSALGHAVLRGLNVEVPSPESVLDDGHGVLWVRPHGGESGSGKESTGAALAAALTLEGDQDCVAGYRSGDGGSLLPSKIARSSAVSFHELSSP